MQTIPYKYDEDVDSCNTVCPFGECDSNGVMFVGSINCMSCEYFHDENEDDRVVFCKHEGPIEGVPEHMQNDVRSLHKAKEALSELILEEIDMRARLHNITEIAVASSDFCVINGMPSTIPENIQELLDLWFNEINSSGFVRRWTKEKGWN